MRRGGGDNIGETEEDADAEENETVDQRACETLSTLRHAGRDEDVADAVGDVDPDRCANHGRQDVSPVVGVFGDDGEQQHADNVTCR